jgi:type I restriction enzyme S subunit
MSAEWTLVRLEEITSVLGDGLHGTPIYDDEGCHHFINGNNLLEGRIFINEKTKRVSEAEAHKHRKNLNDRSILVSINGTLGNLAFYRGEKVVLGKSACYFNVSVGVDKYFVRYVLQSDIFQSYLHNLATGSTIKNVSLRLMRDFSFRLPPFDVQKRISAVLKALDDRITLLRETNATLEAIAQALFKSWFVDFDPVRAKAESRQPQGMDAATAALFPDSFEASELGLVPKGWEIAALKDVYEINPSRKLKKDEVAPYLDMASVGTQGHVVSGVINRAMGSGTKFINGDTLLARITPCLENGKTAYVDFLKNNETGWGSTEFVVLRPKPPLPPYHGYLLARYPAFRDHAIQSMSGTSGRQRVQNDVLGSYPIAVPTPLVAEAFAEVVGSIQQKISDNQAQAQTLTQLRDTLLPRLISGQLRLPEAQAQLEA